MTTAYTSLLGLALPVTGELSGTWGDVVNDSITSLLDTSVAGTTNISTDANVTLTTTTGASNQARQAILLFSGARTAIRTVTAPAQSKIYTVINATTGGFAVTLVGAGPTTGVTIANGARTVVAWNGSDFVEVSSPSSIILPGGTANGVLYLNGSKVVTSGSALTFDGTNLGVANTSGTDVTLLTLTSNSGIRQQFNPTNSTGTKYNWRIDVNGLVDQTWSLVPSTAVGGSTFSTPVYQTHGNGTQIWSVGSSEGMRLTSTGLGIGTSSPADILTLAGGASGSYGLTINNAKVGGGTKAIFQYDATNQIALVGANTTNGFAFQTLTSGSLTTKATLDSSGNLGLGVTPSAWSGSRLALQIGGANGGYVTADNGLAIGSNYAYASGDKFVANGYAPLYFMSKSAGSHQWFISGNNASGAGAAWTPTQAMTLDASGNFLVGTTSANGKFHVRGTSAANMTCRLEPYDNNYASKLLVSSQSSGDGGIQYGASGANNLDIFAYDAIKFLNGAIGGSVGTERARIDASGNLLVGTTSGSRPLCVRTADNKASAYLDAARTTAGTEEIFRIEYTAAAPNTTTSWFIYANDTAAQRFSVRSNGGIANYQANDVNLSDRREKTNFALAGEYLSKICAIPVQTFNYIDQSENDPGLTLGVVAQDVQAVAPELVMESDWSSEQDGSKMRLSIYQTDLQYALMKCIQEQQAIIESLKARLDAANL